VWVVGWWRRFPRVVWDFDSTRGFPGEGPTAEDQPTIVLQAQWKEVHPQILQTGPEPAISDSASDDPEGDEVQQGKDPTSRIQQWAKCIGSLQCKSAPRKMPPSERAGLQSRCEFAR
jgi:hypothetical protein